MINTEFPSYPTTSTSDSLLNNGEDAGYVDALLEDDASRVTIIMLLADDAVYSATSVTV